MYSFHIPVLKLIFPLHLFSSRKEKMFLTGQVFNFPSVLLKGAFVEGWSFTVLSCPAPCQTVTITCSWALHASHSSVIVTKTYFTLSKHCLLSLGAECCNTWQLLSYSANTPSSTAALFNIVTTCPMWLFKFNQIKIQFLSWSSHISRPLWPHVVSSLCSG